MKAVVAMVMLAMGMGATASAVYSAQPKAAAKPGSKAEQRQCSQYMEKNIKILPFDVKGLKVASLEDPTRSTGATLFYFPKGAMASYDARGGSVGASQTNLLDEGSYSNVVDGVLFTGGSLMGLGTAHGVERKLFKERSKHLDVFESMPSVPAAVVYDFGGRIEEGTDARTYPTAELGENLLDNLKDHFLVGRTGAGRTTSVNKIGLPRWGGQGAAYHKYSWGNLFVAVVLNACGDVVNGHQSVSEQFHPLSEVVESPKPGKNTTLSIVITDAFLTRGQLKRLAVATHTSMARSISPFQTYTDGDIQFAVSTASPESPHKLSEDQEWELAMGAQSLMAEAIQAAVLTANREREIK